MSGQLQPGPANANGVPSAILNSSAKHTQRAERWFVGIFATQAGLSALLVLGIVAFLIRESAGFSQAYTRVLAVQHASGMDWADAVERMAAPFELFEASIVRQTAGNPTRRDAALERWRTIRAPVLRLVQEVRDGAASRVQAIQIGLATPEATLPTTAAAFGVVTSKLRGVVSEGKRNARAWLTADGPLSAGLLLEALDCFEGFERGVIKLPKPETLSAPTSSSAFVAFLTGSRWETSSVGRIELGLLPLLIGSIHVSAMAFALAVPLGLGAAVYVSQLAGRLERIALKPLIEFMAAIPTVVLGFLGCVVVGPLLKATSESAVFRMLPGFPLPESLNAGTAALLLAFMAVPTVFALAEDALSTVPKSLRDGSLALGASPFQTLMRLLLPGIAPALVSSCLLAFGRIIGETMVVLLCSGGKAAIPNYKEGLASLFAPIQTMPGIIAQEIGHAPMNSLLHSALFLVGLTLLSLTLLVNLLAQLALSKTRRPRRRAA
jgi:phosphate transport system permease protein